MKNLAHFLLVFIAIAGEIGSSPSIRSACSVKNIKKKHLIIEETSIKFRNSTVKDNEIQMFMRLTEISKDVKDCMDKNKFNLKINLKQPLSEDNVKIGSTATQHIVSVGKKHLGIESCTFDDQKVSDEHLMLLNFIGSDNSKAKEDAFQEIIVFIAPVELTGLEKNIKSLEIEFEDEDQKKTCGTYRGFLINLFYIGIELYFLHLFDNSQIIFKRPLYDSNMKLKLQIQNNDQNSPDAVRGKLSIQFPGQDVVYIQGTLGIQLARKICHSLGYSQGKIIIGQSSAKEKSPTFTLKSRHNENHETKIWISYAFIDS